MLKNKNIIKYHTVIINCKMKLTENELNLLYILSAQIDKDDENFHKISFKIADLERKTRTKWNQQRLLKELENLNKKPLEVYETKDGKKTGKWTKYFWLSSIGHDNGIYSVVFSEQLKPFLLKLKGNFEQVNLKYTLDLESSYAKRIYIMLKEYQQIGKRSFNIKNLQEALKVPASYQSNFALFKQKVLDKTVEEINRHTDLRVEYKPTITLRKKIQEIEFTILANKYNLELFIKDLKTNHIDKALYIVNYENNDYNIAVSKTGELYFMEAEHIKLTKAQENKYYKFLLDKGLELFIFQDFSKGLL